MLHIYVIAESFFTLPVSFTHFLDSKPFSACFILFVVVNFIFFLIKNSLRSFHVLKNFVLFENGLSKRASFLALRATVLFLVSNFLNSFYPYIHTCIIFIHFILPSSYNCVGGRVHPSQGHIKTTTSRDSVKLPVNQTYCACFWSEENQNTW